MSIQCRGAVVLVTVALALLSSRPVHAQAYVVPGPVVQPRAHWYDPSKGYGRGAGVQYDVVNKAVAEHKLGAYQARLQRDVEAGNTAAADRHSRRIGSLQYRIAAEDWLIRKNTLCPTPYYPIRNDSNCLP